MIDFKNITIKYGDFVAMDELDLHIKEGEFFSFLGPSGSGKTTVLRTLTGFVNPSEGEIYIDDEEITNLPIEKRNIGIVFQSYALFPTMNVYENIAYGLKVKKVPKEEIKKLVYEIAEKIDLDEEQLYKRVGELSGGQQQRVAIARAMVIKPKILCLDEPLSNLDAKLRVKLRNELKMLQRDFGITTIYVTHDQEEALTLSDRIAVFDNGNLQQVGTPREIYNNPETEFVANFIGEVNKVDSTLLDEYFNNKLKLDKNKKAYLLMHNLKTKKEDKDLEISGKIIEKEFFGYYFKYTLETNNGVKISFMTFVNRDLEQEFNITDNCTVYTKANSIKQFSY